MKKILLSGVALFAMMSVASAADLAARHYTKAPAPVAPVYNWTGFYVGAHLGGAFSGSNHVTSLDGDTYSASTKGGFLGGGQLGYNYQFAPNWVLGIEGDISGLDYKRSVVDSRGDYTREKTNWLASVTGRLGYTWGLGLLYVKGGAAFRDNSFSTNLPADYSIHSKDTGYTIGGGLEYMFAPAWSAKIEYQYYDFSKSTSFFDGFPAAQYKSDLHTVKAGINYHFNWGGPVVARY